MFFLFFLILFRCNPPQNTTPPGILSPVEMTKILVDIHIAETAVQFNYQNPKKLTAEQLMSDFQNHLLNYNGVDKDKFFKSYQYYTQNIEKADEIYLAVIDSLARMEAKIKN